MAMEVLHVMTPAEWGKPIDVDEKWIQFVDHSVRAKFPPGTEVEDISPHGASYWTRTAEISTRTAEGSPRSYFLKVSQGENGRGMVAGEFESMKALYETLPKFVPTPIGTGTYTSASDIHFFICDLINMTDEIPEIQSFTETLAELHTKGISPNGKYGFYVPTYKGTIPQYTEWHDTWEESFLHSLKWFMDAEERSQGIDEEMQELCKGTLDKVIPRLLRPLETGGRQILPRLIHGDIWAGNASTNIDTGLPIIYDGACLYAHNEMEMAAWRPIRHLIGRQYMKAYFKYFPVSAPKEDQDDRNLLYYLRWDLKSSALFSGNLRYRNMAKETMRTLINKFPNGYEGWAKERGEEPVQRHIPPTKILFHGIDYKEEDESNKSSNETEQSSRSLDSDDSSYESEKSPSKQSNLDELSYASEKSPLKVSDFHNASHEVEESPKQSDLDSSFVIEGSSLKEPEFDNSSYEVERSFEKSDSENATYEIQESAFDLDFDDTSHEVQEPANVESKLEKTSHIVEVEVSSPMESELDKIVIEVKESPTEPDLKYGSEKDENSALKKLDLASVSDEVEKPAS